jgi:CTP synthase
MRLGGYRCLIKPGTKLHQAYRAPEVVERHRHRYEVNPLYRERLEEKGLIISGESPEGLIEAVELQEHPWFVGVQFHPEFTNKLQTPNPVIVQFIAQSYRHRRR